MLENSILKIYPDLGPPSPAGDPGVLDIHSGLTTLDKLEVGAKAKVVRVSARCSELRHKLLSLGVVAGTRLEVTAVAPLRDPMNIRLLGFMLSLRLCEAGCITVEKIEP